MLYILFKITSVHHIESRLTSITKMNVITCI